MNSPVFIFPHFFFSQKSREQKLIYNARPNKNNTGSNISIISSAGPNISSAGPNKNNTGPNKNNTGPNISTNPNWYPWNSTFRSNELIHEYFEKNQMRKFIPPKFTWGVDHPDYVSPKKLKK